MAKLIQSPLPGTFYRRPSPDEPPFVEDGGSVSAGDTIGLIEVMKTFHEIKAEDSGSNVSFKVENAAPVTAGATLAEMD